MNQVQVSDAELWMALKQGDSVAFGAIYSRYSKLLIGYSYRLTSDSELIKDCLHELFFELWKNHANLKEIGHVKFYLFHSLRNKIRNKLKKNGFMESVTDESQGKSFVIESYESLLIDTQREEELNDRVKIALKKLTSRQAEAVNLRFYHNFSNEEISEIMGIGYQTATNTIYQALKVLKKELSIFILEIIFLLFS